MNKWWAGALLGKMLLICAKTTVEESRNLELAGLKKEKTFWPSGDFLVLYFRDVFLALLGVL